MSLSDRVRADSEAAPWVIEEIKNLEEQLAIAQADRTKLLDALVVLLDAVKERAEDAKRYRWLRARNWSDSPLSVVRNPKEAVKLGHECPTGERLDNMIDAAMKEMDNEQSR